MSRFASRVHHILAGALAAAALGVLALPRPTEAAVRYHPAALTGGVTHVLDNSAEIKGAVNPSNSELDYFFEYGPTTAYGSRTPAEPVSGDAKLQVAKYIAGLQPATIYHFRIVAAPPSNPTAAGALALGAAAIGRDHTFTTKGMPQRFALPRSVTDTYGSSFLLSGTLQGSHSADAEVSLQASSFPFLEPFAPIGSVGVTNSAGAFSFRIANLSSSTQFRVLTVGLAPLISAVVLARVAVRVSFHVRSSGVPGLVRLYGTFTPAIAGARVSFEIQKAVRPGPSEATEAWAPQFRTSAHRAGGDTERFSTVVKLRHSGRYRVFVAVPHGKRVSSGASSRTIVLHAAR